MKMLAICFSLLATAALAQPAPNGTASGGMIDPRSMAGTDIGAKVNAAIAAMPATGGTVRIPAGSYSFSTTMKLTRPGEHLACDAGAVLRYTGDGDAILMDPAAGGGLDLGIDGEGGCELVGSAAAQNGVHLRPGNTFVIRGMRIHDFTHGNGIELSGANSVQIAMNVIQSNHHGIDMVTVPHFASNAVHVEDNEISANDWGVYSYDGHVPATRALGNVYRDNVLEGNHIGDIFLGWDAHTLVEGNYFESTGVAVAAGADTGNVYDIHIVRNYFTVNGAAGYRSEVELGYGFGFFIEGNYEEGITKGAGSECAVNAVPGPHGGTSKVVLRDAFSRVSEGKISAHEFCYRGSAEIPPGVLGDTRLIGDVRVDGDVHAKSAQLSGPLELGQGAVASTESSIRAGEMCTTEGMLLISRPANQPARLFFCSGFHWQAVAPPRP
ncbi:MAG TPA: right-handed parallel beta-helix repeat-containing protein [Acidobacteriaceae bacterium]|nr:right-handed parallel beta-helix repeat-containing protein [Acidobacteriaceae bacterium]